VCERQRTFLHDRASDCSFLRSNYSAWQSLVLLPRWARVSCPRIECFFRVLNVSSKEVKHQKISACVLRQHRPSAFGPAVRFLARLRAQMALDLLDSPAVFFVDSPPDESR